jgi:hypothetical protein
MIDSAYSLQVLIRHDVGGDEGQMIEIPITVLKGDPSPAQNPIPLVPVHQLIDVRQSMVNQQMQQWPRE